MKKTTILPLVLLTLSQGALAQQIPGAGSQLQQLPPTPVPQQSAPDIRIEPTTAPASSASDSVKVLVNVLRVSGAHAFSEAKLVAVSGFHSGAQLSLADLQVMASRITE